MLYKINTMKSITGDVINENIEHKPTSIRFVPSTKKSKVQIFTHVL